MLKKRTEKVYWEEYINSLSSRLKYANRIKSRDYDLAILLSLTAIDGLSKVIFGKNSRENFKKILEKYADETFFNEECNRDYLYKTFRCMLAHGNILPPSFKKTWGSIKKPGVRTDIVTGIKTVSIPIEFLIKTIKKIIIKLKKEHSSPDDSFEIELLFCNLCNFEFFQDDLKYEKCVFCKK